MLTETRRYLMIVLMLSILSIVSGCSAAGKGEWKWERCYEGPPRAFEVVSVLLVARQPVPLRIRSIDGERARDATEYHLLPGDHVVVAQPVLPRNFIIEYRDDARALATEPTGECTTGSATAALTFEPGIVYRLTADLAWEKDGNSVSWRGRRGKWCPRVEAMGSVEVLKGALAHQQGRFRQWRRERRMPVEADDIPWPYIALQTSAKPPKHWEPSENDR